MYKFCSLLTIISILLVSVANGKQPDKASKNYMVISRCGGMVLIRHATIYCINDKGVTCDTIHGKCFTPKSVNELTLDYHLPAAVFAKVKDLPTSVPAELINNTRMSYGRVPVDGMSTRVLASINGKTYSWSFGSDEKDSSPEVQHFYSRLVHDL